MKFSISITLMLSALISLINSSEYEKFFAIDGGPEYMYYFAKLFVGTPPMEQSAIIDTGSDTLAFPCDHCKPGDCGSHQDPRFHSKDSKSFQFDIDCSLRIPYHNHNVCQFIKSYAEGSSLLGFLADDYVKFKNSQRIHDIKLSQLNSHLKKDIRLKAEFGCTTKETGLFKTQYADGILGLDQTSTFIESVEAKNSGAHEKVMSFGLCFHSTGGIMSVDLRDKHGDNEKHHILNRPASRLDHPLVLDWDRSSNYYEVRASHFSFGSKGSTYSEIKDLPPVNIMIDSGTTFSHFPDKYIKRILEDLNSYCRGEVSRCGRIPNAVFNQDSCLELKQPDANYKNEHELLATFPEIRIHFGSDEKTYILYPKNYFYKEFEDDEERIHKNIVRLCFCLKGEEEGRIILGAFSMIDNYFYFDRLTKQLKIYKENCYLRAATLLKKDRILSAKMPLIAQRSYIRIGLGTGIVLLALYALNRFKKGNDHPES